MHPQCASRSWYGSRLELFLVQHTDPLGSIIILSPMGHICKLRFQEKEHLQSTLWCFESELINNALKQFLLFAVWKHSLSSLLAISWTWDNFHQCYKEEIDWLPSQTMDKSSNRCTNFKLQTSNHGFVQADDMFSCK